MSNPKSNKFKVGDKIIRVRCALSEMPLGSVWVVSDITNEAGIQVSGQGGVSWLSKNFELVEDEPIVSNLTGNETEPTEDMQEQTPYQKKGYTENSLFKYIREDGNFELGEVIKLHSDDGSYIPAFKSVSRDRCIYCSLDFEVEYIGEKGDEDMLLVEDALSGTENEQPVKDNVNSPSHYKTGKIECIVATEGMLSSEEFIGYLRGKLIELTYKQGKEKSHG